MRDGGEIKYTSGLTIMEALALIPTEMSRRLKEEYRIIDVSANAALRQWGGKVTLWEITVEYEVV